MLIIWKNASVIKVCKERWELEKVRVSQFQWIIIDFDMFENHLNHLNFKGNFYFLTFSKIFISTLLIPKARGLVVHD